MSPVFYIAQLVILCLCSYLAVFNLSADNTLFTNDMALSFAVADDFITSLDVILLGPPSHVGGRHLGPLYFYYLSLVYLVANKSVIVASVILGIIRVFALQAAFTLALLPFFRPRTVATSVFLALLIIVLTPNPFPFRVPWHGNDILLCGAIILTASILSVQKSNIWLLFLGCSASLQLHYGSLPLIAIGLSCYGVASRMGYVRQRSLMRPQEHLVSLLLLIVLWLPSLFFIYDSGVVKFLRPLISRHLAGTQRIGIVELFWHNLRTLQMVFEFKPIAPLVDSLFFVLVTWIVAFANEKARKPLVIATFLSLISLVSIVALNTYLNRQIAVYSVYIFYSFCSLVVVFSFAAILELRGGRFASCARVAWPAFILLSISLYLPAYLAGTSSNPHGSQRTYRFYEVLSERLRNEPTLVGGNFSVVTAEFDYHAENALLCMLGRKYYWKMCEADKFEELTSFQKHARPDRILLITGAAPNLEAVLKYRKVRNYVLVREIIMSDQYLDQAANFYLLKSKV